MSSLRPGTVDYFKWDNMDASDSDREDENTPPSSSTTAAVVASAKNQSNDGESNPKASTKARVDPKMKILRAGVQPPGLDEDACWHGSSEENFFQSEYQDMILELILLFNHKPAQPVIRPEQNGIATPQQVEMHMQQCFRNVAQAHPQVAVFQPRQLSEHAFAFCARQVMKYTDGSLQLAFISCSFALYFCYINTDMSDIALRQDIDTATKKQLWDDRVKQGNETFNAFHKKNNSRRGVIRILAKHLPCTCFKTYKKMIKYGIKVEPCDGCRQDREVAHLKHCSRCNMVSYCSRECQTLHWKKQHKLDCRNLQAWGPKRNQPPTKDQKDRRARRNGHKGCK